MNGKRPATILALLAVIIGTGSATFGRSAPDRQSIEKQRQAAKATNAFAVDMYKQFAEQQGNIFYSPFSVSTALGMTSAGANAQTLDEMLTTLHWTSDGKPVPMHDQTGTLLASLNEAGNKGDYELAVANRIWPQKGYVFLKSFLDDVEEHYGAKPEALDYARATEQSRKRINEWVEDQTNDRIKNLLPSGILTSNTRLVLTNAIYFKGDWKHQFNKKNTRNMPFFTQPDASTQVPMMWQKENFSYKQTADVEVVTLPYEGKRLSMVVVLPKKKNGLAALEKKLSAEAVADWTKPGRAREIEVYLPKFKLEYTQNLNDPLQQLGMKRAFGMGADFSGMTGSKDLQISQVVHKAFIEVNEEGSEAAAATAVIMFESAALPQDPVIFKADHPFLFVIKDNVSGAVLFMGRYVKPVE